MIRESSAQQRPREGTPLAYSMGQKRPRVVQQREQHSTVAGEAREVGGSRWVSRLFSNACTIL